MPVSLFTKVTRLSDGHALDMREDLKHADHKLKLINAPAVAVERHDLLALRRPLDERGTLQLPGRQ